MSAEITDPNPTVRHPDFAALGMELGLNKKETLTVLASYSCFLEALNSVRRKGHTEESSAHLEKWEAGIHKLSEENNVRVASAVFIVCQPLLESLISLSLINPRRSYRI